MIKGITITGIKDLNRTMNKYRSVLTKDLGDETRKAALNVERNTKKRLSSILGASGGRLITSYHTRNFENPISADVFSNLEYAPFVEFGTGTKVFDSGDYNFTAEDKEYASQFKRGPGRNMSAKPALFPSWEAERPEFIKRVRKVLGDRARGV